MRLNYNYLLIIENKPIKIYKNVYKGRKEYFIKRFNSVTYERYNETVTEEQFYNYLKNAEIVYIRKHYKEGNKILFKSRLIRLS